MPKTPPTLIEAAIAFVEADRAYRLLRDWRSEERRRCECQSRSDPMTGDWGEPACWSPVPVNGVYRDPEIAEDMQCPAGERALRLNPMVDRTSRDRRRTLNALRRAVDRETR